jgi:hypothetical protein
MSPQRAAHSGALGSLGHLRRPLDRGHREFRAEYAHENAGRPPGKFIRRPIPSCLRNKGWNRLGPARSAPRCVSRECPNHHRPVSVRYRTLCASGTNAGGSFLEGSYPGAVVEESTATYQALSGRFEGLNDLHSRFVQSDIRGTGEPRRVESALPVESRPTCS